jgi:hypothetical protein
MCNWKGFIKNSHRFLVGRYYCRVITEFVVNTGKSYTSAEHDFLKGPKGRYIMSLYMSIKILLHDKGMMTMESDI